MNRFTGATTIVRLLLAHLGFGACLTGSAAVTFSVTPSTMSNTYSGFITLQATGLNSHETVVVQRYMDLNANSVVDGPDWLMMQFQVTDGQGPSLIGGATNINVPFDSNSISGVITVQLSPIAEGIFQTFVGQSLFVLSSPSNHFSAITNTFTVTAFNYSQSITGTVLSNSTPVANAMVMISNYRGPGHDLNPLGGVIANTAGVYTIKAPPGTYQLHGFKNDLLAAGSPPITLGASTTVNTNVFALPASNHISGRLIDAIDSIIGLPGILMAASANGVYGFAASSSNGTFSLPVNAGQWKIGGNVAGFSFQGYVTYDESTNFNVTSNLTGITLSYPRANALFYGRVRDGQGTPVAGLKVQGRNGNDGTGIYEGEGITDRNGNYAVGVIAPSNWDVEVDAGASASDFSSYVFSLAPISYNNGGSGTNLIVNRSMKQDFTALLATNNISGYIRSNSITPLVNVRVEAQANNINGSAYHTETATDTNGHYVINVPNGTWIISLNCCTNCDSGGLPPIYQCPDSQMVTITGQNATIDFDPFLVPVAPAIADFTVGDGLAELTFSVQEGDSCEVQASSSVDGPWTVQGSFTGTGTLIIFHTSAFGAQRYFRIYDFFSGLYSTNTAGYVNVGFGPSWNLIANPLLGSTYLPQVFARAADGTVIYKVAADGLDCSIYDESSLDWFDCVTGGFSITTLEPGEGAFFHGGSSSVQTFAGIVPEGTLTMELSAGISLCSSIVPQAGGISSDLGFPAEDGDVVYKFNPATQAYNISVYYADLGEWDPSEPVVFVGEAFWLELASDRQWVRYFSVTDGGSDYSIANFPYSGGPNPLVPGSGSGTAPSITSQPQSRTNVAGSDATFTVSASGSAPLSYQWRLGNSPIPGATASNYTILNVQASNAGNYSVVVSNPYGTVTSAVATLTVQIPPCATRPAGLIGWWRAENNAVDSVGTNHGTLQNGVAFASGKVGEAFSFDGVNDSVDISSSDEINFAGNSPMSVAVWVYRTGSAQVMHILGKRFDCNFIQYQLAFDSSSELSFGGDGGLVATHIPLPLNVWKHLVGTFDGATLKFYIDGQEVATAAGALGSANSQPLKIGASGTCGGFFEGLIDEVALFNRALTSNEIAAIYAAGTAGMCFAPNLVQNGSFENGANPPSSSYRSLFAGDTSIAGWVVSSGRVDWSGNPYHPKDGQLSAQLVDDGSAISQSFNTLSGQTYEIRFALQHPYALTIPATVNVSLDGSTYHAIIPPGPSYTWHDYATILTATSTLATLTFENVNGGFVGPFVDVVSVAAWTGSPIVITEPQSQTKLIGANAELELQAVGTSPIYYQWRLNGGNIADATNSTLSLLNLQAGNAGNYSVIVSNAYGTVTSAAATLQLNAVFVDAQPVSGSVTVTNSAQVQIATGYTNGAIFYTLNGDYPGVGQLYYGPFTLSNSAVLRAIGYSADYSLSAEVPAVSITVLQGPTILSSPTSQSRLAGQAVAFAVSASGVTPFSYQWYFNGSPIPGATAPALLIPSLTVADAGSYSVLVGNQFGTVASDAATLTVFDPVAVTTQPVSTNVPPNTPVTFSVTASGSPPLQYQWRLNGANLPGKTNSTLSIPNVQLSDGGTYTVVVLNEVGTAISDPALLTIVVTGLQPADNFANRVPLSGLSGAVSGNSFLASKEAGEPNHAGKPGGKSVWYKWTAPASGLATFHTQGSSFDTVLAIYQGTDLTSLNPVAANDDGGGNLTSEVQFNALSGTEYSIAIDGVGGTGGYLILSWALQAGGPAVPVVLVGPQDIAVVRGNNGTFSVTASGPNLGYEWQFDDSPIQGATNSTLIVGNVQLSAVGIYSVRVSSGAISIFSGGANLEMVTQPGSVTRDKLADASAALPGPGAPSLLTVHSPARLAFTPISFGIPGSQDFANAHSATDLTDPAVCAVGGSSRWLIFRPATGGLLSLDTIGTAPNLPTIIAAYRGGTVADIVPANLLGCDVNSAPDGHSLLRFQVQANTSYSVLLDATNGVTGLIHLNYCLGSAPPIIAASSTSLVREGGGLTLSGPVSTAAPAPSYQWYRNGVAISGATQLNYNLSGVTAASAGVYSLVASNCVGIASNVVTRINVQVPLNLNFVALRTGGKLDFHLTGSASQGFMIQGTTNFLNWIPLFTNPTPFTPINFADPASGTRPNRFYRAAPWQP